ncbi:hypothetical protein RGQ21_67870 [Kitasatospora aureofaciens]|nr:hypothetical protein RGQ21_67870 [Kitasatospora aureofaciens]
MFKVGDRVVVVRNLLGGANTFKGQRGEVVEIVPGLSFSVRVMTARYGEAGFYPEELEFEETYDAMSAPHPDEDSLFSEEVDTRHDDVVNHPSHYADGWSNGAEVIDITEHLNFNRGNAVKYLSRAGKKGGSEKELEDLQKALWYVTREVLRLGGTV